MSATAINITYPGQGLIRAQILDGPTRLTFWPGHAYVHMSHGQVVKVIVYWHGPFTRAKSYNPKHLPGWLMPVIKQMVDAWELHKSN